VWVKFTPVVSPTRPGAAAAAGGGAGGAGASSSSTNNTHTDLDSRTSLSNAGIFVWVLSLGWFNILTIVRNVS